MVKNIKDRSIDPASQEMLAVAAKAGLETAWDRFDKQQPQCGFGELGLCCRNCNMGPCRIDPFGEAATKGVCGATADIIVARNLLRAIAAGASAHSDHARDVAHTFKLMSEGKAPSYQVKDQAKLARLMKEYGVSTQVDLANAVMAEFGKQEGPIQFISRAPAKRQEIWKNLGIEPRGIDREIVECMHRTTMGVDNDHINLLLHGLRASLGRWLGRVHDRNRASRRHVRHAYTRSCHGELRSPGSRQSQHHSPRSRASALRDDRLCGQRYRAC